MRPETEARPETAGGRIFFSGASRALVEEDEIQLTSVGVDIGSSTAHADGAGILVGIAIISVLPEGWRAVQAPQKGEQGL